MAMSKIFAAVMACSALANAWTPLPKAQLSSFVFPGAQDAYGWRGSRAPTCENLSCDVRNTGKWTDGQKQLDDFAAKWGGSNQQATAPDGTPMIATFGHCLVKTQRCGQCGMMKFAKDQEYQLSTGRKFTSKQSLSILVMCIDNAEAAASFSYETDANDYLAAIKALGAHDLDTNAHPLVTDIAPAHCLSGAISDSATTSTTTTAGAMPVPVTTTTTTTLGGEPMPTTTTGGQPGPRRCASILASIPNDWCDANCNHQPPYCPDTVCSCTSSQLRGASSTR